MSAVADGIMGRILCVDDEPHVVSLRCLILNAEGYRATHAWTVSEALDKLKQARYELVITGWRLCDGGGEVIVKAAKSLEPAPVVVVSGYVADGPNKPEPVADAYFEKVIEADELLSIVRRVL